MMDRFKDWAPVVTRVGLSLVFLWFGINQLLDPSSWLGYLPAFVTGIFKNLTLVVQLNGAAEVILGAMLIVGLKTRIASFLLFLHLLGIAFSLGYNDVMVRDLGLSLAAFSVFLHGPDKLCIDRRLRRK